MTRANVSRAARAAAGGIGETIGILATCAISPYSDAHAPAGRALTLSVPVFAAPKSRGVPQLFTVLADRDSLVIEHGAYLQMAAERLDVTLKR